jgi:hypothetical protein
MPTQAKRATGPSIPSPTMSDVETVCTDTINPGRVFDLVLPLEDVAEGYRAMDERRAIKTLLRVGSE